jgi:hypothetical protein
MQATVFTDNNATVAKLRRKLRKRTANSIIGIPKIAIPETSAMTFASQPEVMGDLRVITEPAGPFDKPGGIGTIEELDAVVLGLFKRLNGEIVNTEVIVKSVMFRDTVQGVTFVNIHTIVDKLLFRHRQ